MGENCCGKLCLQLQEPNGPSTGRTLFAKELCLCFSLTFILLYFEGGFALSKSSQKGNFKCLGKLPLGYGLIRLSIYMHACAALTGCPICPKYCLGHTYIKKLSVVYLKCKFN